MLGNAPVAMQRDGDVDVFAECCELRRRRQVVALRRYVPRQFVGLDDAIQRRARSSGGLASDLPRAGFESPVKRHEPDGGAELAELGDPVGGEQVGEHLADATFVQESVHDGGVDPRSPAVPTGGHRPRSGGGRLP